MSVILQLPRPKLRVGRYGIIWSQAWLYKDSDGEKCDEPEGEMRYLDSDDDLDVARGLLPAWVAVAGHKYGPGVVTVVDRDGNACRVERLHPTCPGEAPPAA